MASKARKAFDESAADVNRLLEIHAHLGGEGKGRRYQLEVLNKSAIVLITAIWEAYCEDIAAEALECIVKDTPTADSLPVDLKKRIAKELKNDSNEIAIWGIADLKWKALLTTRLKNLRDERNRKLNTPKSDNISELFKTALGIPDITGKWRWKKMSQNQAKKKLDEYIELRGAIAHRGAGATSCKKAQVKAYFAHVKKLVSKTGGSVNSHVIAITGKSLW